MTIRETFKQLGLLLFGAIIIMFIFKPTPPQLYDLGKKLGECQAGDRLRLSLAIQTYKLSILMDKSYIKPYYEISDSFVNLAYCGTDSNGRDIYDQRILLSAENYLSTAEKMAPDAGELHKSRAYLLKAKGDMEGAKKEAMAAVSLEPENYRFHAVYGVILLENYFLSNDRSLASQAIEEFKSALAYNPTTTQKANILDFLGLSYQMAFGHNQEAIRYYEESLRLNPDNWVTRHHYEVAKNSPADQFERRQKNFTSAVRDFQSANNTKSLYLVAKEYLSYNDYKQAEELFKQVVAQDKNNYEAYGLLGYTYYCQGNTDEALKAYEQAIKINKRYDFAYGQIGYIKYLQKDLTSSIDFNLKAVSLNNKDADAYYTLARAYEEQGDHNMAVECCQKSIYADPNNGDRYYGMAIAVGKNDNFAAIPYLQRAVDLGTSYDYCYLLLSSLYGKQNQYKKAQLVLEKALEMQKAIGSMGLNGLAWCYVHQNINQEAAVQLAYQASYLAVENMEIIDTLSKAFINLGKKQIRETHYFQAIFSFCMSVYVWIDNFFNGLLFLIIVAILFLQFVPRLFFRYKIAEEVLYFKFLSVIPLGRIMFYNIEEIRELKGFESLKYIFYWSWRNRLFGKKVLIKKKNGLIKWIILTPKRPEEFVDIIKSKINTSDKKTTGSGAES